MPHNMKVQLDNQFLLQGAYKLTGQNTAAK